MTTSSRNWDSVIRDKITEVLNPPSDDRGGSSSIFQAPSKKQLASMIDHTLLKPDVTPAQIDELCDQAIQHGFKSCCVNGVNVSQVAKRLEGSSSIPCCVVGFPLGAGTSRSKAFEAAQAITDGAKEIDTVINIGAVKAKDWDLVYRDIKAVVDASGGHTVKVILETVFLTDEEKVAASFISAEAGAKFVKTCTGFSGGGASAADVALMKRSVAYKGDVHVKASAGIRSYDQCIQMIQAGASRIGTSSSIAILNGAASS